MIVLRLNSSAVARCDVMPFTTESDSHSHFSSPTRSKTENMAAECCELLSFLFTLLSSNKEQTIMTLYCIIRERATFKKVYNPY